MCVAGRFCVGTICCGLGISLSLAFFQSPVDQAKQHKLKSKAAQPGPSKAKVTTPKNKTDENKQNDSWGIVAQTTPSTPHDPADEHEIEDAVASSKKRKVGV
jgi:hypothetical protein